LLRVYVLRHKQTHVTIMMTDDTGVLLHVRSFQRFLL